MEGRKIERYFLCREEEQINTHTFLKFMGGQNERKCTEREAIKHKLENSVEGKN
jgi:hypothetical protein